MIITRKTDNDFYKFTMGEAVYRLFPTALAEYVFKCRTAGINLARYAEAISREIDHYCNLRLQPAEGEFLKSLGIFSPAYLAFLRQHQSSRRYINLDTAGADLILRIRGPWIQTIFDEVPLLAIISQTYMEGEYGGSQALHSTALQQLAGKTAADPGIAFSDFGTRRRFSRSLHEAIIPQLVKRYGNRDTATVFTGTSNVALAMDNRLLPVGTMAHEWLQAGQALTHPRYSQQLMLRHWLEVFGGQLGIALTDIIGIDAFLADFTPALANAYTGVRHDSGSADIFTEKLLARYTNLGIDPATKTVIYSDGLDFEKALQLKQKFGSRIHCAFGIGTNLTNNVPGTQPPQIVIKLVNLNGLAVAKISDSPGKGMCEDARYVEYLKGLFCTLPGREVSTGS